MQHPELAAGQLEYAVKKLGLRGALIGGSVNGEELSDSKFHPFWAKAEELGVLIFIHPQSTPDLARRLKGKRRSGLARETSAQGKSEDGKARDASGGVVFSSFHCHPNRPKVKRHLHESPVLRALCHSLFIFTPLSAPL